MQISITGRHMEITESLRTYTHEKLEHGLMDFPRVESVHVILDAEKFRRRAEIVVQGKNHIRADAHDESDDMYASIDGAIEKMARQLRRLRDKVTDHKHRESVSTIELGIQSTTPAPEPEG